MDKFGIKIKGILKCGDEFLIVKKWYDDRIDEPYQWEFLDTTIEDDETPEMACLRYILNCTGIYAQVKSIPYTWSYKLGDNRYIGIAILCEVEDNVVIMSDDIADYRWVEAGELDKYIKQSYMLKDMKEAGVI